ncbi:hypothetical protein F5Y14DRAFT_290357 [Nemania sp. NC0429]|nr:hypothetical protein F5Y14DRAFT_290357 [Nemania sp. NC0429]
MAASGSPVHEELASSGPATPEAKRRKLRKGTRSCWECKRRKNKCTWSHGKEKCDGCYHRDTPCRGQELPEEHVSEARRGTNKPDDSKLRRLEALAEKLARQVNSGKTHEHHHARPVSDDTGGEPPAAAPATTTTTSPRPDAVVLPPRSTSPCLRISDYAVSYSSRATVAADILQPSLPRLLLAGNTSFGQFGETTDAAITPLIHGLVAAWPSKQHHDAILRTDLGLLHPALSSACSGFRAPPSPEDLLKIPPPGTTPVAIARKLLALGAYLQVVSSPSGSGRGIAQSNPEYHIISSRAFETVSKLVTHNDDLPESVEIIECLIIESQYHNYIGNVRRAWIVMRRAMAMAQLLGLDRQRKTLAAHATNVDEAQGASQLESMWFVLVHYDQYLSLVLGISPNLPEYSQTALGLLEKYTPSQRMSRLHSMATGRILQRNRADIYNVVETMEIDKLLQQAAACMPAQWWLPPDWHEGEGEGDAGIACVVDRLMVHFAHYNILLQVHLPPMIRSLASSRQHYPDTSTAINCSREILTRFTVFRSRHPAVSYCRGLDIFAFVASIALCLLHIHTSSEARTPQGCGMPGISSSLLAHQRPTHRGLVERALQCIEKISQVHPHDKTASRIIPVFRKLLVFEEEACMRGTSYTIQMPPHAGQSKDINSGRVVAKDANALYLDVPFCGTIKVERANMNISDAVLTTGTSSPGEMSQTTHILLGSFPPSVPAWRMAPPTRQASTDQLVAVTERGHVDKHRSGIPGAGTTMASLSDSQRMLFNGSEELQGPMVTSELLAPATMGALEGQSNPTAIDADLFDQFWDIQ